MSDAWLPPLIKMSDSDVSGNWTAFLAKVYGQFEKDFVHSKPVFLHIVITADRKYLFCAISYI